MPRGELTAAALSNEAAPLVVLATDEEGRRLLAVAGPALYWWSLDGSAHGEVELTAAAASGDEAAEVAALAASFVAGTADRARLVTQAGQVMEVELGADRVTASGRLPMPEAEEAPDLGQLLSVLPRLQDVLEAASSMAEIGGEEAAEQLAAKLPALLRGAQAAGLRLPGHSPQVDRAVFGAGGRLVALHAGRELCVFALGGDGTASQVLTHTLDEAPGGLAFVPADGVPGGVLVQAYLPRSGEVVGLRLAEGLS